MVLKLYMTVASPPVRAVLLTAKALNIDLEQIDVDLAKQEHLNPEYLKLNPQHTVPMLDDNGQIIWDSHAIIVYLVSKYGKDDSLYPKDLHKQAIINQRLHFDSGVLFPAIRRIAVPIFREGVKTVQAEKAAEVIQAYEFLEQFLNGHDWMVCNSVTIADLSLIASISSVMFLVPVDGDKFPNLTAWIERVQHLPYYHANQVGLERFKSFVNSFLES